MPAHDFTAKGGRSEIVKRRPDQKAEAALDQALADTFPASAPIAALQPTAAGLGPGVASTRKEPAVAAQRKETL